MLLTKSKPVHIKAINLQVFYFIVSRNALITLYSPLCIIKGKNFKYNINCRVQFIDWKKLPFRAIKQSLLK